jgi:hypothetical protein
MCPKPGEEDEVGLTPRTAGDQVGALSKSELPFLLMFCEIFVSLKGSFKSYKIIRIQILHP